jgi:hypothetical protein
VALREAVHPALEGSNGAAERCELALVLGEDVLDGLGQVRAQQAAEL